MHPPRSAQVVLLALAAIVAWMGPLAAAHAWLPGPDAPPCCLQVHYPCDTDAAALSDQPVDHDDREHDGTCKGCACPCPTCGKPLPPAQAGSSVRSDTLVTTLATGEVLLPDSRHPRGLLRPPRHA